MSAPVAQKIIHVVIDALGVPSIDPVWTRHGETVEWTTSSGQEFDLKWPSVPAREHKAVAGKSWGHASAHHHLARHLPPFDEAPETWKYTITLYDAAGNVARVNDPDMVMDT